MLYRVFFSLLLSSFVLVTGLGFVVVVVVVVVVSPPPMGVSETIFRGATLMAVTATIARLPAVQSSFNK